MVLQNYQPNLLKSLSYFPLSVKLLSEDLVKVIEESWAREKDIPPYHIYLKIAYHLAQEARVGLSEFSIPRDFGKKLFDYQTAAVKIAAHHLNKRGGVLIGDVVGLGKTLMATALARIFEDDYGLETLIICPKNLVTMWDDYCVEYRLRAKIKFQSARSRLNFRNSDATAWCSLTRATIFATGRANVTGHCRSIFLKMKANVFF